MPIWLKILHNIRLFCCRGEKPKSLHCCSLTHWSFVRSMEGSHSVRLHAHHGDRSDVVDVGPLGTVPVRPSHLTTRHPRGRGSQSDDEDGAHAATEQRASSMPPCSHQRLGPSASSVVIGPARLSGSTDAPETLEHGGVVTLKRRGRRIRKRYQPRPFMGPAFDRERPKLPAMWRDSVG